MQLISEPVEPETYDATCDLECQGFKKKKKKKPKPIEYVGPLKITLIEPTKRQYWMKLIETGLITLAFFFMGMCVATTLQYTLTYQVHWTMNIHVMFNTLGCQFCITSAYLLDNDLFIPSLVEDKDNRLQECKYLTIVAHVMFLISNSVVIYVYRSYYVKPNAHAVIGLINFVVTLIYTPALVITLNEELLYDYHYIFNILGIFSYVCSMLSYITGMFQNTMMKFLPHYHMAGCIAILCVFYSLVAIKKVIMDVMNSVFDIIRSMI